jgi:hypothetical protein
MAYTSIDDPTTFFNTILYTGNNASNRGITGVNFAPNWVWIKKRNATAGGVISDTVRGAGKVLYSSETNAEGSESASFVSFDSDGYTISQDAGVGLNVSSDTYVGWNWKAGTSFSNDASATGIGTIDSSASVSADAGFSIVSYTGTGSAATIAHGIGSAPDVVIIKKRSTTSQWCFGTNALGFTKFLELNLTSAAGTNSNRFNDTAPTSSVFSIGTEGDVNASSGTYIAYCFAEKKGYSKFGSYTGNGNADGTFVHLGFKPAWVLYKKSSGTENWFLHDNKRQGFNPDNELLFADLTNAEGTVNRIDLLSNGFKATTSDGGINGSGATYIYMAFAEAPFVNSSGVPNNAR